MTDTDPLAPKISTAAIEMLALECDDEAREWASMQLEPMFERIAASLRALAAERDAQAAEIEKLEAKLECGLSRAKGIEMACLGLRDEAQPLTAKEAARKMIAELTGDKP